MYCFPCKNNKLSSELDGSHPNIVPAVTIYNPSPQAQVKNTYPVDGNNSLEVPYFTRLCIKYLPCVLHELASPPLCVTSLVTRLRVVLSGSSPTFGRDLSGLQLVQSSISSNSRPRGAYHILSFGSFGSSLSPDALRFLRSSQACD